MKHYIHAIKNYVNFKGRASRSNYWFFVLFNILFSIAAVILDAVIGISLFYPLYILFALLPSISVTIRRLHDINKSGWWYLIGIIPIVGAIWLLVYFFRKGDLNTNNYGDVNTILK
jgi:uncharacterized membrane protein YhaH (DUF805 family)